jgi:multidrug efflux pump subunit AcrB
MWIVRVALDRPYTFIVLALLILILSPVVILRTPTDIFPNINIPVVAVAWQYTGLNPEELEGRLTSVYERILTTTVDNIEHIESTTVNGQAIVKIFLQPGASLDSANAQVTAVSQAVLRQLPPGTLPPLIINYSASSVPILQLGLSGQGLSEQQLNDMGQNFIRPQLVTVPGAVVPWPYGGKQRQVMIDLDSTLLQSKGVSPQDVLDAVTDQNLVLPGGTAKIDEFEYDVRVNASPRTVAELNDLPIKQVGSATVYLPDVANIRDGFAPQPNIERQDGRRGVLLSILKAGTASTISVVQGHKARVWTAGLLIAAGIATVSLVLIYLPVKIEGNSMTPLLSDHEAIVINRLVYHVKPIHRGDVVVFRYPLDATQCFIKRIVGLPGETVQIRQGLVYVNGDYTHDRNGREQGGNQL